MTSSERVLLERNELVEKIVKLGAFLQTGTFRNLSKEEAGLLEVQYHLMSAYSIVLLHRLILAGVLSHVPE